MSEIEYLVRGAQLYCDKGSHPRRINLPKSHGVYLNENALIRKNDCKGETNISFFGICSSETPPDGAEEILLAGYVPEGANEEASDVQGLRCTPDIIGMWRNVKSDTEITGSFPAVTTASYLICNCGGIIQPLSSGQEYED